jgi:hypothetical protein
MIKVLDNLSLGACAEKPSKHRRNKTGLKLPGVREFLDDFSLKKQSI